MLCPTWIVSDESKHVRKVPECCHHSELEFSPAAWAAFCTGLQENSTSQDTIEKKIYIPLMNYKTLRYISTWYFKPFLNILCSIFCLPTLGSLRNHTLNNDLFSENVRNQRWLIFIVVCEMVLKCRCRNRLTAERSNTANNTLESGNKMPTSRATGVPNMFTPAQNSLFFFCAHSLRVNTLTSICLSST